MPVFSKISTVENINFSEALFYLKGGHKLAREGWNGKDMWIVMMPGLSLPSYASGRPTCVSNRTAEYVGRYTDIETGPYLVIWTAEGKWQPGWLPSQSDLFAEDWYIVQ